MLKFLLERIVPKDRLVHLELPPMENASDAGRVLEAIMEAVAARQISPSEAAALGNLVEAHARIMENSEIKSLVDDLETRVKEVQRLLENWLSSHEPSNSAAAHPQN